jgi:hypothetical protein
MSGSSPINTRSGCRTYAARLLHTLAGCTIAALLTAESVVAAPVYQPPGSSLTYGDVVHNQRLQSGTTNPAAAAADVWRAGQDGTNAQSGMVGSMVFGIEFGNLDRFYERVDEISDAIKPSDPDPGVPGDGPPDKPGGGPSLGDLIEICCPDLANLIDRLEQELIDRAALLTLISVDGYAKGFRSFDLPVMLGKEIGRGAWSLGLNWSESVKAYGIADADIDFRRDTALSLLSEQYDLMPGDPMTTYDVGGDVSVTIDPATGETFARFDNDSTLLSKGSKTKELTFGYSRRLGEFRGGNLFVGADAHFYALELARLGIRFGDITSAKDVFESIKDLDYVRDEAFGFDVGVLWVADRFQLGASLTNVNEPGFDYPDIDLSGYSEASVIDRIRSDRRYIMDRQLKLEASVFNEGRRRTLNIGIDADTTIDPMGDEFQWFTFSAGMNLDTGWLPNLRVGYRRNLAGSELSYLGIGATMFKWFNVDTAFELNRVKIDENNYPRGAILSLGFQVNFQ